MSKTLHAAIGSGSADPFGVVAPEPRVLALTGPDVSRWADGVFAVIEANDETAETISGRLEEIFKRNRAPEGLVQGQEETYLSLTLEQLLHEPSPDGHSVAVAVAIWRNREVAMGSLNGAGVLLCRNGAILDPASLPHSESKHPPIQVDRATIEEGDCLVLTSPAVAQSVGGDLLAQTLSDPFSDDVSIDAAALWLVTLASDRRGHLSSVLLAQFEASAPASRGRTGAATRRRWGLSALRPGSSAVGTREEAADLPVRPEEMPEHPPIPGVPLAEISTAQAPSAGQPMELEPDVLETIPFPSDLGFPEDVSAQTGVVEEEGEDGRAPELPKVEPPEEPLVVGETGREEEEPDRTLLLRREPEGPALADVPPTPPVVQQPVQEPSPVGWTRDVEPDSSETIRLASDEAVRLPSEHPAETAPAESVAGDVESEVTAPPPFSDRESAGDGRAVGALEEAKPGPGEREDTEPVPAETIQLPPASPEPPAGEIVPPEPPVAEPAVEAPAVVEEETPAHDAADTIILPRHQAPEPTPVLSGDVDADIGRTVQLPSIPSGEAEREPGQAPTAAPPMGGVPAITGSEVQAGDGAVAVVLSGTAVPGSRIEISDWTVPVGTTVAGSDGGWSVTLTSVEEGTHTYRAKAVDADGNLLGSSAHHSVSVDAKTSAAPAPPETVEHVSPRRLGRIPPALVGLVGAVGGIAALIALAFFALRSGSSQSHTAYRSTPNVVAVRTTPTPTRARPTPPRAVARISTPHAIKVPIVVAPRATATPTRPAPTATPRMVVTPTTVPRAVSRPTATPVTIRKREAVTPTIRPTARPTATAPKKVVPRPTVVPTRVPIKSKPALAPPQPARSWVFSALGPTSKQVILTVSNQNSSAVDVYLRSGSQVQHVRIPAESGAEMELTSGEATRVLSVTSSAPILPARLIVGRGAVHVEYGTPSGNAP